MRVTMLGLGESSAAIAKRMLEHGVDVVAFEPTKPNDTPVPLASDIGEAVIEADVLFSLNSSGEALQIAQKVSGLLKPGAIYCDLNTTTPSVKQRLNDLLPNGTFVDGVLMRSLAVSGVAAKRLVDLSSQLGLSLEYVSDVPGEAAARNLLRTSLDKGLASIVIDFLWAAKESGVQDWALEEVKSAFTDGNASTVQNYLADTQHTAKRSTIEMSDVSEMLSASGYASTMAHGVLATLSQVMHGKRIPFADKKV